MKEEVEPRMAAGADKKDPAPLNSLGLTQSLLKTEREFADGIEEPKLFNFIF